MSDHTPGAIWENESAWRDARYSPAYVAYLKSSLPPTPNSTKNLRRAQEALWETPIVKVILEQQARDGAWSLGGPPWFRVYPRPLLVLLDYGMAGHPAVRRGVEYLVSTIERDKFSWPRAERYDPQDYYIRHQGACLQVMAKAARANDPRVQAVARRLFGMQRWDGGWSIKPDWMYGRDEAKVEPRPSCWICTLDVMRGLGMALTLPRQVVERTAQFWEAHLKPDDVGQVLECTEFCATQHVRADNSFLRHLLDLLGAARGPDGTIPGLSGYFEIMAGDLKRRVQV